MFDVDRFVWLSWLAMKSSIKYLFVMLIVSCQVNSLELTSSFCSVELKFNSFQNVFFLKTENLSQSKTWAWNSQLEIVTEMFTIRATVRSTQSKQKKRQHDKKFPNASIITIPIEILSKLISWKLKINCHMSQLKKLSTFSSWPWKFLFLSFGKNFYFFAPLFSNQLI